MLFRTKFLIAFVVLGAVAIGAASLLIVSSQRNEVNQLRSTLAHESLSGYFQLSSAVFRTFKQTRRDLISGSGLFAFDFDQSVAEIDTLLDNIETTLRAEAELIESAQHGAALGTIKELQNAIMRALADIQTASDMITGGRVEEGRQKAIDVLQGQVDLKIATLIEQATNVQRAELASAQLEIREVQESAQRTAWVAALVSIILSGTIFSTLLRRFQSSLKALDTGASQYAENNLSYTIDLPGRDELSAVAFSFTTMAQRMKEKQETLESARQELELRVQERTSELSAANAELRTNDSLRRQFFADIGHELRTPVSAIRGEAEVALRTKSNQAGAQKAALKTIISISDELTASVSDLFLIARDMAGVLDFRNDPIDLNHAVSLGIEQVQSLSGQRKATISVNMPKDQTQILGDQSRIAQLVRILITNSLDHSEGAVKIDVSLGIEGKEAVLSIADDGPGIPEHEWPRIFDRFVKGSEQNSTTTNTGLGLAIAKSIVMGHGGAIFVQRSASGGADLLAKFPLCELSVAA